MKYCGLYVKNDTQEIDEKRSFLKISFRMFVNYYVVKLDQRESFPEGTVGK